jgi:glycosyltransferase involved in cell wall biosynthesis
MRAEARDGLSRDQEGEMQIWLVTIGEPVPAGEACRDRPHRAGALARYLAVQGHAVTWWTSTFDHFRKRHWNLRDTICEPQPNLQIRMLHGGGYARNVSWARIRDHQRIAAAFARQCRTVARPDLIVASLPSLELCDESVRFGREADVPVVLDMRDMWPDIFLDLAPRPLRSLAALALRPLFRMGCRASAGAAAIIGVTESFVEWGVSKAARPRTAWDRSFPFGYERGAVSQSALDAAARAWDARGIDPIRTPWVACFFGTFGRQLDLATVLAAARILRDKRSPIQFVLCGTGDLWNDFRRQATGLSNVTMPGWVDAAAIQALMARSHVGLDPLPQRFDFLGHINNKAVEYLSAGLPVISSPDCGTLAELLAEHQAGGSYAFADPQALVALLERLYSDPAMRHRMAENARQLFEERFAANRVHAAMETYFMELASLSGRAPERELSWS